MVSQSDIDMARLQGRSDGRTCPGCGAACFADWQMEMTVCERCLFSLALGPPITGLREEADAMRPSPRAAQALGSYSVFEEIGRGGMGVVYRAAHRVTGEVVALKTVLPEYVGHSETLARFRRESAVAQSLDHPHSIPIHEVGCSAEGVPFFSMRLASGGSLYHLGAKYRGRWRQIAGLLVKISNAVDHGHKQGILHRDLKPGNILFTEDHEPMVTDFGLAKPFLTSDDLTQSCAVLGTPNYASPEQAAGKTRDLTPAADIYSLGAILFELLTGRPPFVGDNPLDVLRQAASQSPDRPRTLVPSIPKPLETICLRCLERRPEDRYHSAHDLADDLGCWLQGSEISSRPVFIRLRRNIKLSLTGRARFSGAIALAALLLIAWIIVGRAERDAAEMTPIAVAIDDLDQNAFLKRVARQATDGLRRNLSKSPLFRLQDAAADKSHPSSEVFDPLSYGRACNAQAVLTGCARRSGEQVRLTTRLLRCDTGEMIWHHLDLIPVDQVAATLPTLIGMIVSDLQTGWRANLRASGRTSHFSSSPEAQTFYTRALELAARTNQHDLNAAVILLQRASDLDPHYAAARSMLAFARLALADTYGELDKLPLAMAAAREALVLDVDSAQAHRVIASCYSKAGRQKDALEEFWKAVEINPQSAGCCQSLGICLREMGHPGQAIPWLTRAVQFAPARCGFNGTLGETLFLCGRDQEAEKTLQQAIELNGDQPELQIELSALRTWHKQFDEARRMCAQTRLRFPDSRFGLSLAAWIEFCDGKGPEARTYFEKLRAENSYAQNCDFYGAINPTSALAYLSRQAGLTAQADSLVQEALHMDRDLLRNHPHNPRILHDLAATFAIVGDTERSLHFLEESISAGWVEHRSSKIDPRFAAVAMLPRFKEILDRSLPDLP